jgi:hypothetical protein
VFLLRCFAFTQHATRACFLLEILTAERCNHIFLEKTNDGKKENLIMEKDFLIYLLYITLIEIRERSHEQKDNRTFWLCDMLHNVPAALKSDEDCKEAYKNILDTVKHLGVESWLDTRKNEFYNLFPEYQISN